MKEVYVTFNGNSKEWPIYKQRIETISKEKGWKEVLTTYKLAQGRGPTDKEKKQNGQAMKYFSLSLVRDAVIF